MSSQVSQSNFVEPGSTVQIARFSTRAVGQTDVGRQRTANEDAYLIDEVLGIYLVCDGMGGHASGQIASDLAARTILQALKSGEPPPQSGEDPLATAMQWANATVFQRSKVDPSCAGMGTTAVGLRVEEDLMHICHCGDSRVYLMRSGQLSQLTRDHSLVNLYEDKPELKGKMGPAASNVIVRAIGLEEHVMIDHRVVAMENHDVFLLCCDGLTDLVDDWMIREIMTSGETLEAVAENLIRAANANGGSDNITVVLVAVAAEMVAQPTPTTTPPNTTPPNTTPPNTTPPNTTPPAPPPSPAPPTEVSGEISVDAAPMANEASERAATEDASADDPDSDELDELERKNYPGTRPGF